MLETEKKDAERQAVRLEKDKNALRNTLDKVGSVWTEALVHVQTSKRWLLVMYKTCVILMWVQKRKWLQTAVPQSFVF